MELYAHVDLLVFSRKFDADFVTRIDSLSGMMSVKCHEKFKNCIRKVQKSGKTGFSQVCPYKTAMPTMIQGMDMAIMLSQLGSQRFEL
ncbi:hypothetical protein MKX01_034670 [Papaver californicum]|nr:hypothetical protein MKX01_034670 [Papaver californicum]